MTSKSDSVVGSKEELYPPKDVRRALGLKPGMRVRFVVEGRRLIVGPVPTVDELLDAKPQAVITLKEARDHRRALSGRLEGGL